VSSAGQKLIDLMTTASREVLLVAPFIKQPILKRITDSIARDVTLICVTRWDPAEILAGVSDLEVWHVITGRREATLRVRVGLHAKLYRADQQCLVGSANLTNKALGWSGQPNLELLIPADASTPEIHQFEQDLIASSVAVDSDVYMAMKRAVDALRAAAVLPPSPEALAEAATVQSGADTDVVGWLPTCRSPDRLFDAYQGRDDRMLTSAFTDGQRDLAVLNVPVGLGRSAFMAYVAALIEQLPVFRQINAYVGIPRNREDMASYLAEIARVDMLDGPPDEVWDTVKLWLLTFFPDRYRTRPPAGAEVFVRGRRLA
jgi:hypothetical protein